jgi:predicted DCC family thiol-disulfide oxidoreductase YuxK
MQHPGPLLLFDGDCAFCHAAVRFILAHERRHDLRFAPLGGTAAGEVEREHQFRLPLDSMVWVTAEGLRSRSAAALAVAEYLGGPWGLLTVFRLIPAPLRDPFYRLVARHRHRVDCALTPPESLGDRLLP